MITSINFGQGAGLQLDAAEKLQPGLLRADNVRLDEANVLSKRRGYQQVARSTTTAPTEELPADELRALFHREDELVLETADAIYSRRECAGDATVAVGTATPAEITAATDELTAQRGRLNMDAVISLPAVATPGAVTDAYARHSRVAFAFQTHQLTNGPHSLDVVLAFSPSRIAYSGSDTGSYALGAIKGQARFAFSVGSTSLAYYVVCRQAGPTRVDVVVLRLELTAGGTLVIFEYPPVTNCPGGTSPNAASPFDADDTDVYVLREATPGNWSLVQVIQDIKTDVTVYLGWPAGYAPSDVYFDCRNAGGVVRFAALPRVSGQVEAARAKFVDGNQAGLLFVPVTTASYTLGVSAEFGVGGHCVAFLGSGFSSRFAQGRLLTEARYVDVESGVFAIRYKYAAGTGVTQTYLLHTTEATALQVLVAPGQVVDGARFVAAPDTTHVWTAINEDDNAYTRIYRDLGTPTTVPASFSTTGSVHAVAVSHDGARFGHAVLRNAPGTRLEIRTSTDLVSWTQDSLFDGALSEEVDQRNRVTLSLDDLGGTFRAVGALWWGVPTSTLYRQVHSWTYESAGAVKTLLRVDVLDRMDASQEQVSVQVGTWPRQLWAYLDDVGVREVYEISADVFVRVDPPLITLAGGNWTRRGPWTRGSLQVRQVVDWGRAYTVAQSATGRVTSPATGDQCTLTLSDLRGGAAPGVHATVFSTHTESGGPFAPVLLQANARAPQVARVTDGQLALSYVASDGSIFRAYWAPVSTGASFVFEDALIDVGAPLSPIYDMDAGVTSGDIWQVFVAEDGVGDVRVFGFDSVSGAPLFDVTQNLSSGASAEAVAVHVVDSEDAVLRFLVAVAGNSAGGGYDVETTAFTFDGLSAVPLWSRLLESAGGGSEGDLAIAVTTATIDHAVSAETSVEWRDAGTGDRAVDTWYVTGMAEDLLSQQFRSALYSSATVINGQIAIGVTSVEFLNQDVARRAGLFLVSPRTGEILGRINGTAGADSLEDYVTRGTFRVMVSRMNAYREQFLVAIQAATIPQQPTRQKFAVIDYAETPNRPAQLQGVAVSAHAGYPRLYDGLVVCEHDWHEVIQSLSVGLGIGDITGAGRYGVAVCWEYTDAQGNLYRSAPTFRQVVVGIGSVSITISAKLLARTERQDVQVVAWRTIANGSRYFRASSAAAVQTSVAVNSVTVTLSEADAVVTLRDSLDQVPGGASVSSQPTAITDFCAVADGRIWSRDPERQAVARFSTFAQEGNAVHWFSTYALQLPSGRRLVSVVESDGRLVGFDAGGAAAWPGGGPANDGAGLYSTPATVPLPTGATTHDTVVLSPEGQIFGTDGVPYLLTRGLQGVEFADAIPRPYERDGEKLRTVSWRANLREARLGNGPGGRVFRRHHETRRWGQDTGYSVRDESVGRSGEMAIVAADGRVLVSRPDDSAYADGDASYQCVVSTPWVRPASTTRGAAATDAFSFAGFSVLGEYLGPHALVAEVYLDFAATPRYTMTVPEATTAAIEADGRPYYYHWRPSEALRCYSVRVQLRDTGEQNATFALQQIDLDLVGDGDGGFWTPPDDQWFQALPATP